MAEKKELANVLNKTSSQVDPIMKKVQARIDKDGPNPTKEQQEKTSAEVQPMINKAKGILNSSNEKVHSLDPDGKLQAQAQNQPKDAKPSQDDELVGGALTKLTGTVNSGIEDITEKVTNMPILKSKILPFLIDLLLPVAEIASGVFLLLGAVLNLVTDLLGLQKVLKIILGAKFSKILEGLSPANILSNLGLDKVLGEIPGVSGLLEGVSEGTASVGGLGDTITGTVGSTLNTVNGTVSDVGAGAGKAVGDVGKGATGALSGVGQTAGKGLGDVGKGVGAVGQQAGKSTQAAAKPISGATNAASQIAKTTSTNTANTAKPVTKPVGQGAKGATQQAGKPAQAATKPATSATKATGEATKGITNGVGTAAKAGQGTVKGGTNKPSASPNKAAQKPATASPNQPSTAPAASAKPVRNTASGASSAANKTVQSTSKTASNTVGGATRPVSGLTKGLE